MHRVGEISRGEKHSQKAFPTRIGCQGISGQDSGLSPDMQLNCDRVFFKDADIEG
jgi:hypothetical protein